MKKNKLWVFGLLAPILLITGCVTPSEVNLEVDCNSVGCNVSVENTDFDDGTTVTLKVLMEQPQELDYNSAQNSWEYTYITLLEYEGWIGPNETLNFSLSPIPKTDGAGLVKAEVSWWTVFRQMVRDYSVIQPDHPANEVAEGQVLYSLTCDNGTLHIEVTTKPEFGEHEIGLYLNEQISDPYATFLAGGGETQLDIQLPEGTGLVEADLVDHGILGPQGADVSTHQSRGMCTPQSEEDE